MGFYDNLAATAARLLARFGQPVTLSRAATGAYDPATSGVTSAAPTALTRRGALFDFAAGVTNLRGNLVQATDRQLLLEAGEAPALTDSIVIGGQTFTIVSIGELNPAGVPVMYDLHVRL